MRSQAASSATCARSWRAGASRITEPESLAWDEPGWLDRATEWIDTHVARTAEVELVRTRPWSAIVRVPTASGTVWFKEDPPPLAFEPALTVALARRRPDCLPAVIAAEGPRMLTSDSGPQLREVLNGGAGAPSWDEILPLYAETQLAFCGDVNEGLRVGTPEKRLDRLPSLFEELAGRVLLPAVERAVDGLGDAIPPTVVHEEVHEGNVFVRDGRPCFLDWAEACVSHPFVGPLLPLRAATERAGLEPGSPEVERLRDLYLEPFTRFAPLGELRKQFAHGYLLAAACRALTWENILSPLPASVRADLDDPVAGWLGVLREVADSTAALGGG